MSISKTTSVLHGAALGLIGLFLAAPVAAQQPVEMPRLLDPGRMGPMQFRILSGRVTMGGPRFGPYSTATSSGGRSERITVGMNNNEPTLSYESTSPGERLSIEVSGGGRLQIRRTPRGTSTFAAVDFEQIPNEPVSLTLGPKEKQRVYRASSLWHLLIAEREVCRQHLIPLLKILHRDWDLAKTAEEMEAALVSAAVANELPDRQRWAALVEQLGDSRFSQREAADRQLRQVGRAVVAYLRQLDSSQLDAEQRYRIRRIILSLSGTEDLQSPEQAAAWLSGDPAVWLALLSRDDLSVRRLAAARLAALLGKPIQFDPAADAPTRQQQIEKLRTRIPGG